MRSETGYRLRSGRQLQADVSVIWPNQRLGDRFERPLGFAVEIAAEGNTVVNFGGRSRCTSPAAQIASNFEELTCTLAAAEALTIAVPKLIDGE